MVVRAHVTTVVVCKDLHCICGNAMQCKSSRRAVENCDLLFRAVAGLQTADLLGGSVEFICFHAIGRSRLCLTRWVAAFGKKLQKAR